MNIELKKRKEYEPVYSLIHTIYVVQYADKEKHIPGVTSFEFRKKEEAIEQAARMMANNKRVEVIEKVLSMKETRTEYDAVAGDTEEEGWTLSADKRPPAGQMVLGMLDDGKVEKVVYEPDMKYTWRGLIRCHTDDAVIRWKYQQFEKEKRCKV